MYTHPLTILLALSLCLAFVTGFSQATFAQPFALKPAVAVEAEFFDIESDWQVLRNGEGNYMVDTIGFQHISGERLLHVDKDNTSAVARTTVRVPEDGPYRLWVRYEYPPFTDARFEVQIAQNGRTVASKMMGAADNPRWAFTDFKEPKAQWDPSWGSEGYAEEVVDVSSLSAGEAQITLRSVAQPDRPGMVAARNIDFVYLTRDTEDAWRAHYRTKGNRLYPILDAFRDSVGPRWEIRFKNTGSEPATITGRHIYNRLVWYVDAGVLADNLAPGATSDWAGLPLQDTAHFGLTAFQGKGPYVLEIRPAGQSEPVLSFESLADHAVRIYIPPYARWDEQPLTPMDEIAATLQHLDSMPAPGKAPTTAVAYGGWVPIGDDTAYHRAYSELYKAIGMRGFPSGSASKEAMEAAGLPLTRSAAVMAYRFPPTEENIAKAKAQLAANGLADHVRFFDYGDEIAFGEWVNLATDGDADKANEQWRAWLKAHRPGYDPGDYWLVEWGEQDAAKLRPDTTAKAAQEKPRLYVDSLLFLEETAIAFAAKGLQNVKQQLGQHVLGGANYSAHPFYYPHASMYIHWFRGGAADFGRHSEYFWQITQAGPMINGYIAEHFRAGMRFNPDAVVRQYNMPHSPGNTEKSFLRSGFTHIAHGVKLLDYFGMGMNETFTENYIDHRDHDRYRQIRDLNHTLGFVEDVLPDSQPVPSRVALLVSDSTERWDYAAVATKNAGLNVFGAEFRKIRLAYHLERFGLYQALTFAGESPDLVVEDDLKSDVLGEYDVLYVVGDSLPEDAVEPVRKWVASGGTLVATSGAGLFNTYREPIDGWTKLFGLQSRKQNLPQPFFRPRQELAFMTPMDTITAQTADGAHEMPAVAATEAIEPAEDTMVAGRFSDGSPAIVYRPIEKGHIVYIAALPGVSHLWSGLQPPQVPDRGPGTHTVPENFNPGAEHVALLGLQTAGIRPRIETSPALIDARLIAAKNGYLLPLANYQRDVGQDVTLNVELQGEPAKVTSAYHGEIKASRTDDGRWQMTVPSVQYGDLLRIDVK